MTETNKPTVAVIIPCHNHSQYVLRAMNSVVEQDYENKLMSIVDDGSIDDSKKVILDNINPSEPSVHQLNHTEFETYSGNYHGVPVIFSSWSKARKQAAARNLAIQLSWQQSDLFMPLDADDLYLPSKISLSVNEYLKSPKFIGLVYSDVILHNQLDDTRRREYRPSYDRQLLEKQNIISNAPLISKMALGYSGLYEESLPPCEDWDLWLRITENFTAIHIPKALQEYTTTGLNCTFTVSDDRWNELRYQVYQRMLERKQLLNQ